MSEIPYSYQFGPVFQTEDERTVLIGKMGLDGTMSARAIKKVLGDNIDLK